jgi:hypothetical protein
MTTSIPSRYNAVLNGRLDSDGGETCQVGFLWGISPPTLTNMVVAGSGMVPMTFSTLLGGLTPSTTYYFRAYATNITGAGYGDILSFTTADALPPIPGLPPRPTPRWNFDFLNIGLLIGGGIGFILFLSGEDKKLAKAIYNTLARSGWALHCEVITGIVQRDYPDLHATDQKVLAVLKRKKNLFRKVREGVYFLAGKEEGFTYPLME